MTTHQQNMALHLTFSDQSNTPEKSEQLFSMCLVVPRNWHSKRVSVLVKTLVARLRALRGLIIGVSDVELMIRGESISLTRSVEGVLCKTCGISSVRVQCRRKLVGGGMPHVDSMDKLHPRVWGIDSGNFPMFSSSMRKALAASQVMVHKVSFVGTSAGRGFSRVQAPRRSRGRRHPALTRTY